jgi:hypothetical protein
MRDKRPQLEQAIVVGRSLITRKVHASMLAGGGIVGAV